MNPPVVANSAKRPTAIFAILEIYKLNLAYNKRKELSIFTSYLTKLIPLSFFVILKKHKMKIPTPLTSVYYLA